MYFSSFCPIVQNHEQKNIIKNLLLQHELIKEDGNILKIGPKGIEYHKTGNANQRKWRANFVNW